MAPSKRDKRAQGDSSSASPVDNRSTLTRAESSIQRDDEGLSESFQSTDTVRRRPEGYGEWSLSYFGSRADLCLLQDQ